jgi:uncharacterized protein YbdZ (MbtH family)
MNINPLGDNGGFCVLVDEGETHSLLPAFTDVLSGRRLTYAEADRVVCFRIISNRTGSVSVRRVCART